MAERIEVLIGVEALGDFRHIVIDGGPDSPTARGGEWGKFFPLESTGTSFAFDAALAKSFWIFVNILLS